MPATDRDAVVQQARQELEFVRSQWHPSTRFMLGVALGVFWKAFLTVYRTPDHFARTEPEVQRSYVVKLSAEVAKDNQTLAALCGQETSKPYLKALCSKYGNVFLAYYLTAMLANDKEFEDEMAKAIEALIPEHMKR